MPNTSTSKQDLTLNVESVQTISQVTLTDPKTPPILSPTADIIISTKVEIPIDTYEINVSSFTDITCLVSPPLPNGLLCEYDEQTKKIRLHGIPHSVTPTSNHVINVTNENGTSSISLQITIEDDIVSNVSGIIETVKTIYSNVLDTCSSLGISVPLANGTYLNEKHNIPSNGDISKVKLSHFTLGLQYDDLLVNNNLNVNNIYHNADDCDVFKPIPFLIRPSVTGLTPEEKDKYNLKALEVINNVSYIVCYAKAINVNGSTLMYKVDKNDDDIIMNDLISLHRDRLHPVPVRNADAFSTTSSYICHAQTISINLTKSEMIEIKNAIDIKYSNIPVDKRYTIREIGLLQSCMGSDDISHAQMAYFVKMNIVLDAMINTNNKLDRELDIGGMMPSIVNY